MIKGRNYILLLIISKGYDYLQFGKQKRLAFQTEHVHVCLCLLQQSIKIRYIFRMTKASRSKPFLNIEESELTG